MSTATKPTKQFPVYVYQNSTIGTSGSFTSLPYLYVYPNTIKSEISTTYIRKPADIKWNYTGIGGGTWTSGPYIYSPSTSVQFELDPSEQIEIIMRILTYAGVIIRDPEIIQAASQKIQNKEINSKN